VALPLTLELGVAVRLPLALTELVALPVVEAVGEEVELWVPVPAG
jgi:hypothetical protein